MKKYFYFVVLLCSISYLYNTKMKNMALTSNLELMMVENIEVFCEDPPTLSTQICVEHHVNGKTKTTQSATICPPMTTMWEQGKTPVNIGEMFPCKGPSGYYDTKTRIGVCVIH